MSYTKLHQEPKSSAADYNRESERHLEHKKGLDDTYSPRHTTYAKASSVPSNPPSDGDSIFDLCMGTPENKAQSRAKLKGAMEQGYTFVKQNVPAFFTPFGGKNQLLEELGLDTKREVAIVATSPLSAPVALTLVTGAAALTAVVAALTTVGSLLAAAGYGLNSLRAGKEDSRQSAKDALDVAAKAALVTTFAALTTMAAAIATALSPFVAAFYLLGRTGATAVAKIAECAHSNDSTESTRLAM